MIDHYKIIISAMQCHFSRLKYNIVAELVILFKAEYQRKLHFLFMSEVDKHIYICIRHTRF